MSNNPLQPDLDALHQSAIDVITHVGNVISAGCAILTEHDRLLAENQDGNRLGAEIKAIEENIRHVNEKLERVKRQELTMTIVAPTSAGKSTIINAIAGQDLLPSRNDPMTVLPTEIVFSCEVTRPKLILDKALMTLLREVWGQLHQKLQQIGLKEAVEQATKNDFPRENVIKEILNSSYVSSQSEVEESNGIQAELIRINDLLRLCGIFGISTGFLASLSEIPRIEVPFPPLLSPLKDSGLGTLALVDTPGPSEDKSLNLVNVVKDRLIASSLVLVVVDYTKIGQTENQAKVKELVDEIAADKGRDRIYIIVNKIDARNPNNPDNPEDLTAEQILNLVKTKYEIDDPQNRVFEMSARQGFLATNFQREKEIYQLTELRGRKSFEALGQEYYAKPWKTQKTTVTLEEMQKAANEFLQDSGFVGFINKAIAPLVTDAAPSMITIKGALNDISQRSASFLSCLSKQKGILDKNIHELNFPINELNFDLAEVIDTYTDQESKRSILVFIDREFSQKFISDFNEHSSSFKAKINNKISYFLKKDPLKNFRNPTRMLWILLPYIGTPIALTDIYLNIYFVIKELEKIRDEINQFLDYIASDIQEYIYGINQNFGNNTNNFINQINNSLNEQHKTLLYKAKQRLEKIILSDLHPSKYYCSASTLLDDLIELMESQKTNFKENSPNYKDFLPEICDSIEEKINGFDNNTIMNAQICLTKDIEIFFEERDKFLKEYEKALQSSLKVFQEQQNRCVTINNKYIQLLDKIANLEKDLKYQQDYSK